MSAPETVEAAKIGLRMAVIDLKRSIDYAHDAVAGSDHDHQEMIDKALDVNDSFAVFQAALKFFDIAVNQ